MNNKIVMAIICVLAVILVVVLLIYPLSHILGDNEGGPINFEDGNSSSEISSDASLGENESSGENEPLEELPDSTIGDDDGFEGSVIPGNSNSSESSSSSNNSSSSSSAPSVNIPGNGNNGSDSTSSNPGSGNSSSGPSVEDVTGDGTVTYEEYISMNGEEQQKFFDSFESTEAFFEWYNAAKAKYDAENESIEIGEGDEIDLGDYTGGNG